LVDSLEDEHMKRDYYIPRFLDKMYEEDKRKNTKKEK
jgi:hypothetical protein